MSSRKLSLQIWRLQRLTHIQKALRPPDLNITQAIQRAATCTNSNVRQRCYSTKRDTDFEVREFVRKSPDSDETVEVEPDAQVKAEAEILRTEVEDLRKEIEELQHGPFAPNSEFMRALPSDLREKVLQALKERGDTEPVDLDLKEDIDDEFFDKIVKQSDAEFDNPLRSDPEEEAERPKPSVSLSLPRRSKIFVTKFNDALDKVSDNPGGEASQSELWKAYVRCKNHVPGFAEMVTDEVWDVLWASQSKHPQRSKHLSVLAEDILESGNLLTGAQWVDYVECLHSGGNPARALEKWEEVSDVLDSDPDARIPSLYLGILLYSENGQPEEAVKLTTLNADLRLPARSLIPVITAFAKQKTEGSAEKAWALYLRVKSDVQNELSMQDYEEISTALLTADEPDLALAVFKDMLVHREASSKDSLSLFRAAHGYLNELQAEKISEDDVNRISLAALTVLPRSFQNKYFYASWIKKLLGLGNVDAAATVIELMYARGVKPDAKHLNGVIGAYFRQGSESSQQKAEALAWSMIEQRFQFAKQRASRPAAGERFSPQQIVVARPVPIATIETFSILLQSYLDRGLTEKAKHLMDGLELAEIKPDAFILNQWMLSHLRKGRVDLAWESFTTYRAMGVKSDLQTFACLFDCGKIQYERFQSIDTPQFPRARALFYELSMWLRSQTTSRRQQVKEQFSKDLYDQIVRCFCLSHDLRGGLCALHGLKDYFDTLPDANTVRMVLLSVARHLGAGDAGTSEAEPLSERHASRVPRRRRAQNPRASLDKVTMLFNAVAGRKEAKLVGEGPNLAMRDEIEKAELQLEILSEFLVIVLARNVPPTESRSIQALGDHIERVAESMGVTAVTIDWSDVEQDLNN